MFNINEETIQICKEAFSRFVGTGVYVGLFFVAILYIIDFLDKKDNKESRIKVVLGVYCIIILILNICPFFAKFITEVLGEADTYWRVYWLLPIGIDIAFMFTDLIFRKEKITDKIVMTILMIIIIVMSGTYMYNSDDVEKFEKVNNYYKVPDNVLDIIFHISNDNDSYKKLAGPERFIIYTRQIDGNIILSEARNISGYGPDSIVTLIEEKKIDEIYEYCKNRKCNYLVLPKDMELSEDYIEKYNVDKLYENSEYCLYKFNDILVDKD